MPLHYIPSQSPQTPKIQLSTLVHREPPSQKDNKDDCFCLVL